MKSSSKALLTAVAGYAAWKVLNRNDKEGVSSTTLIPTTLKSRAADVLGHYVMNILLVALWKTYSERRTAKA